MENLLRMMEARFIGSDEKYRIYTSIPVGDREGFKSYRIMAPWPPKSRQQYSETNLPLIIALNGADEPGVCGIEKDFDSVLSCRAKTITVKNDSQGYIIPGQAFASKVREEWGSLTTSRSLSKNVKKAADRGQSGAVAHCSYSSGEIRHRQARPVTIPIASMNI